MTTGRSETKGRRLSSYDLVAEYYDYDMGMNNPGKDIAFYVNSALSACGSVLELGCGTGRITIPMVQAGCRVFGVDLSLPMLRQMKMKAESRLSREEHQRLNYCCMDMRDCVLNAKFSLIICPYSAVTYLGEKADLAKFLAGVKSLLHHDGRFILDCFVPCYDILYLRDDHVFFDYRREISPGLFLERQKTIEKDLTAQVNLITRYYRVSKFDGSVIKNFSTEETIRYFFREELRLLLESNRFEILEEYGDFEGRPYSYDSNTMVFVCRPKKKTKYRAP